MASPPPSSRSCRRRWRSSSSRSRGELAPPSDLAIEVMRISEVGRHTPLVGAHCATAGTTPARCCSGGSPLQVALRARPGCWSAWWCSTPAIVGALIGARRRGARPLVVLVGAAVLTLTWALGPNLRLTPGTPGWRCCPLHVRAARLGPRGRRAPGAPWLVGVGTFLVQTHLGCHAVGARARAGGRCSLRGGPAPAGRRVRLRPRRRRSASPRSWSPRCSDPTGPPAAFGAEGNLTAIPLLCATRLEPAVGWRTAWGSRHRARVPGRMARRPRARRLRCADELHRSGRGVAPRDGARFGAAAWRIGGERRPTGDPALIASGLGVVRRPGHRRSRQLPGALVVGDAAFVWLSVSWSIWSLLSRSRVRGRGRDRGGGGALAGRTDGRTSRVGPRPGRGGLRVRSGARRPDRRRAR